MSITQELGHRNYGTYIKLPTRWHRPYGMSLHGSAKLIHGINVKQSYIVLIRKRNALVPIVTWSCGEMHTSQHRRPRQLQLLNVTEMQLLVASGARRLCRRCFGG